MQRHHILWYPRRFEMLKTIYPDGKKVLFNYTEIIGEHKDFDGPHTDTSCPLGGHTITVW